MDDHTTLIAHVGISLHHHWLSLLVIPDKQIVRMESSHCSTTVGLIWYVGMLIRACHIWL